MPELREDRVGAVIDRFYEAALRPDLWRAVLQDYADALGAEGALILPGPRSAIAPACSGGLDEAVAVGMRDGWFSDNPRLGRGIPALTNLQGVLVESHIFTPEELDSVPFNADFAGRQGLRWFAGIYLAPEGQRSIMLSAERRTGQEMFSHREVALIEAMVPHLQRAGRMAVQLAEARAESMLDAFEMMACGCLLLDSGGRVVRLNERARAELGGALQVLHGVPVAAGASANAALGR
ncbi:helix-turn-helix transcriptional regulator, partial [Methylobacterium trifolii]